MRAASQKRGIEVTSISRPIRPSDFRDFDLILAMDLQNKGTYLYLLRLTSSVLSLSLKKKNLIIYCWVCHWKCRGYSECIWEMEIQGTPPCWCTQKGYFIFCGIYFEVFIYSFCFGLMLELSYLVNPPFSKFIF